MANKPKPVRKSAALETKAKRLGDKFEALRGLGGGPFGGLPSNMATFEPKVITRPKKGKVSGKGITHLAYDGGRNLVTDQPSVVKRLNPAQFGAIYEQAISASYKTSRAKRRVRNR